MIRVGVIGYGYWGPNLVRNFSEAPGAEVVAVSDLNAQRLAQAQRRCPGVRTTTDAAEVAQAADIDAVVIATPVSAHFPLALLALEAGKHVLVEKPLTGSAAEGERLIEAAARRGLTLMVDHTFIYTGAVRKMQALISAGELGDLYYYDSVRVNLGLFQRDVSVVWDLAVHDLSILNYLIPQKPVAVSATGMCHVSDQPEDIAYLTLFFEGSLIAHIHVNWLAPVKVRRTMIGGSRKMIVYDDLEPSEKVKVYDKGITLSNSPASIYQLMVGYRTGDMLAPHLESTEALSAEARHFIECVNHGAAPLTGGQAGLEVVQILEAATRSLDERGRPVPIAQ